MTAKTWFLSIGLSVTVAAAYLTVKGDISAMKDGQAAAATRVDSIQEQQRREHDKLILMDQKLDYLVNGRRGYAPAPAQP